jgi:hypothetical protein
MNRGHALLLYRGGSPSLLPRHARWIDIVDVQVQSPLAASDTLLVLDGEKTEVPSTRALSRALIPNGRFSFPLWYKQ